MTAVQNHRQVQSRFIYEIAREIRSDWKKVNYGAEPYLDAMDQIMYIGDKYYYDTAHEIVIRFLANASGWRGPVAQKVKKELRALAGIA